MNLRFLLLSLGVLISACQNKPHRATQLSYAYIAVKPPQVQSAIQDSLWPYKQQIDRVMKDTLGKIEVPMPKERGKPETLLGNFVADLLLTYGKNFIPELDFSLLNIGGLRNSLPSGYVTTGDIFQLMPFDNKVVVLELSPEQMADFISYMATEFSMPVAGIALVISGDRVSQVSINHLPWDLSRSYRVITSDYLAEGGDKMHFLTGAKRVLEPNTLLREIIIEHIKMQTQNGKPIQSFLDGRIRFAAPE
jgi:2',3'-cyclic-nucleotide 2'-phosphodiesterase (5'-nucleotidase family)